MKKIISLAFAMVCASGLMLANTNVNVDTDEAAAALGQEYAAQMIKDGKVEELTAKLEDAANGLTTLSLKNNEKALWFTFGVATVVAGYLVWKFGPTAFGTVKGKVSGWFNKTGETPAEATPAPTPEVAPEAVVTPEVTPAPAESTPAPVETTTQATGSTETATPVETTTPAESTPAAATTTVE